MKKMLYLSLTLVITLPLTAGKKFSPVSKKRIAQKIKKSSTGGLRQMLQQKTTQKAEPQLDPFTQLIENSKKIIATKKTLTQEVAETKKFIKNLAQVDTQEELKKAKKEIDLQLSTLTKRLFVEPTTDTSEFKAFKATLAELTEIRDALK